MQDVNHDVDTGRNVASGTGRGLGRATRPGVREKADRPPRSTAWGGPADRSALEQIASQVRATSGFDVCAIEVLRADGMLETVAVAGRPHLVEWMLGRGVPLEAKAAAFTCGATFGSLTFVATEWLSAEAFDVVARYAHVPELPESSHEDAWRPEDMLVARLTDDAGLLRAVLHLDEPTSGRRLSGAELMRLSDSLQLAFRAVVTTVEREALAQQVRMAQAARTMIRTAAGRLDLGELLTMATQELRDAFCAERLDIHVVDRQVDGAEAYAVSRDFFLAIEQAMVRAWRHEQVLIAEAEQVWGDPELPPEHHDLLVRSLREAGMGTLVLVPFGTAGELLGALAIHRRRGGVRWTDSESAAALDVGQDLAGAILQTRAMESEHQLNEELRRMDSYRQELLSTVSHELKNPIGVILGHLEMLQDAGAGDLVPGAPDRGQGSLRTMTRAARRLQVLADDLLTLSRLGAAGAGRVPLPLDLAVVLAEVVDDLSIELEQHRVTVVVEAAPERTTVRGDADDLFRAFANVVGNAVKYSEPGGTVRVCLEPQGEGILLTCTDEGLGISEADQARLFSHFFRSTNPEALGRPGTGLGLPIVQRIVEHHGGRVSLESELGSGTTVRVWLPTGG